MSDQSLLERQRANVRTYLDVSTMHIPEDEAQALDLDDAACVVYTKHDAGYWVWVWPVEDDGGEIDCDRVTKFPGLSAVVAVARELGCEWINFDCDSRLCVGLARREG